jgi:hypothetical protein
MDASYKIQRGIHVHLIQFFMCPEFWVHISVSAPLCVKDSFMRGVGIRQSRDQLDAPVPDSAGVGILCRILEILLFQPFPFLFGLGDIDPLDLEDHRPGPVVATGDHHPLIIGPLVHDGSALEGCVDIPADGVPRLPAEFPVHQVVKIVPLSGTLKQKGISLLKTGAGA